MIFIISLYFLGNPIAQELMRLDNRVTKYFSEQIVKEELEKVKKPLVVPSPVKA